MGNLQNHVMDSTGDGMVEKALKNPSDRVICSCDFNEWKKGRAEQLGFSSPCVDYHTIETVPYTSQKCYSIEVMKFS